MKLAIAYDEAFLDHVERGGHPERPERLIALRRAIEEAGIWEAAQHPVPREATVDELAGVHEKRYVESTLSRMEGRYGNLDPDTYFSPGTKEAALKAAGAAIDLARLVWTGGADVGLALVRPPGHHAEANRAAGFCIFNNIAVATAALRRDGVERILIFDWDVHHGNGTQHEFESDPGVLFVSVHAWPHYPGSGQSHEVGRGDGKGYTVNVPYPHGATDVDYAEVVDRVLRPLAELYRPQMVAVSAGFDAHRNDMLGGMRLTEAGYGYMARAIREIAASHCGGKILLCLEGGYDLQALSMSMVEVLRVLDGKDAERPAGPPGKRQQAVLDETLENLRPFWQGLRS
jgi:acetoin utilization deacetylase AcuC-like enzyme